MQQSNSSKPRCGRTKRRERLMLVLCAAAFVPVAVCAAIDHASAAEETYTQLEAPFTAQAAVVTTAAPVLQREVVTYDVPLEQELQDFIADECEKHHIEPTIVFAMIGRESGYQIDAVGDNGQSYGLMQIQPRWHYQRMLDLGCTNLHDAKQNVTVGIDILADLIESNSGDYAKALVCYNQGSFKGAVTEYAQGVLDRSTELKGSVRYEFILQ